MTQVFYFLVLTFNMPNVFGVTTPTNMTAVALPEPMLTLEACATAAKAADENYTGEANLSWTCVPQELEVVE